MEIPIRSQFDSQHWVGTIQFDTQAFFAHTYGGIPRLGVQAQFRRARYDNDQQGPFPVLLDLHGSLARPNNPGERGMTLLPVKEIPIHLLPSYADTLVNLIFEVPERYTLLLEEERAKVQGQDVFLALNLWATAAMVAPPLKAPSAYQARLEQGEILRFERLETDQSSPTLKFERSFWIDRILPGLGYRRSVLIELPLMHTPQLPDEYTHVVEALENARRAFDQEDYRGAIKYGREVLEFLGDFSTDGSRQLTQFCKEYLIPKIGETKSMAVDTSLASVRRITNASSHATLFVADRATAAYVIEMLALNLRYIASAVV